MMSERFSAEAARLLLEALAGNQHPFLDVQSNSMAPLLRRGDQVQLASVSADGPNVGDVIVVGEPGDLLAHRFWDSKDIDGQRWLLTRGDRLAYYDSYLPWSLMRATVIARRRSGKVLALNQGSGAWLNHRLAQLARMEASIMRLWPPAASSGAQGQVAQYGFARRLARRGLVILATLLTAVVGILPEQHA